MNLISALEAGKRWGIAGRVVCDLCRMGRMEGAVLIDGL